MSKTYSELRRIESFKDRYNYLKLNGTVGMSTFGHDRHLNQMLYTSDRWRRVRDEVIIRDEGCDLGVEGYEIYGRIIIHHIIPITVDDILEDRFILYDLDNLITTTNNTHNAIHYGDESLLPKLPIERRKNDTIPWA